MPFVRWFLLSFFLFTGCSKHQTEEISKPSETVVSGAKPVSSGESPPGENQDSSKQPELFEFQPTEREPGNRKGAPKSSVKPLDRSRLQKLGIEIFDSQALILLSDDVKPEKRKAFQQLPTVITQLISQLNADYPQMKTDVQLTGSIMRDQSLYLQAGLLPATFIALQHGGNIGQRFWMNEQKTDYYRRHLMIHEAVHCLMEHQKKSRPLWYWEGMAELYALHQTKAEGKIEFAIFPGKEQIVGGFGRLRLIRDEIKAKRFQTVAQVRALNVNNFYPHKTSYGWSWALCRFLATHPETKSKFPRLMNCNTLSQFNETFEGFFPFDDAKMNAEWAVFVSSLVNDFDIKRNRIDWKSLQASAPKNEVTISADRNWQNSGIQLVKAKQYTIAATGSFSVAQKPEPWVCEPQGVSVDYVDGQPLGQLQAVLFTPDHAGEYRDHGFLQIISVGRELKIKPKQTGKLFFRINDRGSSWADNQGSISVSVAVE